jgi:thiol:disulfide interchange protein DsbD
MRVSWQRLLLLVLMASCTVTVCAQEPRPGLSSPLATKPSSTAILPVDQAFRFSAVIDGSQHILLSWSMRPGYYLYQQKLEVQNSEGHRLVLTLPPAETLTDEFTGESKVYFDSLQIVLPIQDVAKPLPGSLKLKVIYQGCAQDRYCYPLVSRQITLNPVK